MVGRTALDRLINRAAARHSAWDEWKVDVAAIARAASVRHAADLLVQLGYRHLAKDLLRLEKKKTQRRMETAKLPAA